MCTRTLSRTAFGRPLAEQGVIQDWIAESRVRIEQARLLVLKTAWLMDTVGNKGAHTEIQAIKIVTPAMAEWVIDKAIQAHGGGGVSQDFPLAHMWAAARTLRFADGPDEVHKRSLARRELGARRRLDRGARDERRGKTAPRGAPKASNEAQRAEETDDPIHHGPFRIKQERTQRRRKSPSSRARPAASGPRRRGGWPRTGWRSAVLDLDEAACEDTVQAIEAAGGRALAVGADVSRTDQVQAAVERVAAELGGPPVLVNNAGRTARQPAVQDVRRTTGTWCSACTCAARS